MATSRPRIQAYLAASILLCSVGGLSLAGSLVSQARSLDQEASLADVRSAATRDVRHLATLVRQWLVTIDLVTGHNGSYLWEGAQDQAKEIDEQLADLSEAALIRKVGANVEELQSAAAEAQAAVVESAFLDPSARHEKMGLLVSKIDDETMKLVRGIEELQEAAEAERVRAADQLALRRARFVPTAGLMSAAYLLLVFVVWRWSVARLVRPIAALTDEALGHQPFGDVGREAPREIVLLSESLQGYASSLEAEKSALAASEERSRDEAARTRAIMEATPHAILVVDREGTIRAHNGATKDMLRLEDDDLMGEPIERFFSCPEGSDLLRESLQEIEGRRQDGSRFPVELATASFEFEGAPAHALVGQDRTDQRRLESELRQSQKQEALGQLAAGLAHELNTPIQFVGDCIHFFRDAFSDLAELLALYRKAEPERSAIEEFEREIDLPFLLDEIPAASERTLEGLKSASELIRATQELVHPAGGSHVRCDVHRAIQSAVTLARHRCEPVARTTLDLGPVPPAHCGHGELVQVMVNLLSNGADAVASNHEAHDLGRLRVSCDLDGEEIRIRVSDDGPGVPEELRSRIFDPFFTTKEVGKGSGQGLSIAHSIVQGRYGGKLGLEIGAEGGTTFEIRLRTGQPSPDPALRGVGKARN